MSDAVVKFIRGQYVWTTAAGRWTYNREEEHLFVAAGIGELWLVNEPHIGLAVGDAVVIHEYDLEPGRTYGLHGQRVAGPADAPTGVGRLRSHVATLLGLAGLRRGGPNRSRGES